MNPLLWQIAIDMASAEAQKSAKVAADVAAAPPPAAPAAPMPAGDPGMGGGDPSAGGDPMATIVPIIRQIVTEVMTQQGGGAAGGKPGMPGKKSGPAELMAALEEQGRKVDYLVTLMSKLAEQAGVQFNPDEVAGAILPTPDDQAAAAGAPPGMPADPMAQAVPTAPTAPAPATPEKVAADTSQRIEAVAALSGAFRGRIPESLVKFFT
jgi:hypothetical protein